MLQVIAKEKRNTKCYYLLYLTQQAIEDDKIKINTKLEHQIFKEVIPALIEAIESRKM